MARHADRSPRRLWSRLSSVKVRAVLCLGIFFAPAGVGTMAYWTDQATIESGTFTAGTLDLTVGAAVADSEYLEGQGGTFEYSQLTIGNLIPGESIARPFVVRNFGSVPFTYNAGISTENDNLVSGANGLRVKVYVDGAPDNTGTEAAGTRKGTCTGTLVKDQAVSTTTGSVDLHATDQGLAPGATRTYCAVIELPGAAPNSLQGEITSLIIGLRAKQLGAP